MVEIVIPELITREERLGLQSLGITITGKTLDDQPFVVQAYLPEGWTTKTKGKSSTIVMDKKGRERVKISHSTGNIYHVEFKYFLNYWIGFHGGKIGYLICKNGKAIDHLAYPVNSEKSQDEQLIEIENKAIAWLNKYYPKWRDLKAYWD